VLSKKLIAVSIGVILVAFVGISLAEIDFVRWFTCNSPFAAPEDQASDVCRRFDKAP
jgi:hypothetical protein